MQTGASGLAVAHYERALARRPDDVEIRNNLATALLTLGRRPEAIAELERVVTLQPAQFVSLPDFLQAQVGPRHP